VLVNFAYWGSTIMQLGPYIFKIMMKERPTKCRSKIDILNIWFTLKMHFVGLSFIIRTTLFIPGKSHKQNLPP
jgi:hypothetical protein